MRYLELKGARVPALGLGTQGLLGDTCLWLVRCALEVGYRFFDTSEEYGNEVEIGRAIRESGVDRGGVFVATKVSRAHLDRPGVRRACEASLARLGTDYVDLLLVHWPDPRVPLAETLDAFAALRAAGMVRHVGVCNFPVALLKEAIERHGADLLCNQVEYHVLLSQRPMLSYLRARGMMLIAYSPLARGVALLSPGLARLSRGAGRALDRFGGRYARTFVRAARNRLLRPRERNPFGQAAVPNHPTLARIGARHGKSAARVALRWLIEQPSVAAIPRPDNERHCRENFELFDFALSVGDQAEIAALAGGYRVVDPAYAPAWDVA